MIREQLRIITQHVGFIYIILEVPSSRLAIQLTVLRAEINFMIKIPYRRYNIRYYNVRTASPNPLDDVLKVDVIIHAISALYY